MKCVVIHVCFIQSSDIFQALSNALEYYDDLTGTHVLTYLDEQFSAQNKPSNPTEHKARIFDMYEDKRASLTDAAEIEVAFILSNYLQ